MLKDFLKSPTPEELHSVLAYILTVGEEQQVCFIHLFSGVQFCNHLTFSARYFTFNPNVNSPIHPHGLCYSCVLISTLPLWPLKTFLSLIHISWYIILLPHPFPHNSRLCRSGGEGLGCALWAVEEQPSSRAGAGRAAGVGRGAAVLLAAHTEFRRWGQRESLQGEEQAIGSLLNLLQLHCLCDILSKWI